MKFSELLKKLDQDGWKVVRQEGTSRFMSHPVKVDREFAISFADDEDIGPGCLNRILKHAGLL